MDEGMGFISDLLQDFINHETDFPSGSPQFFTGFSQRIFTGNQAESCSEGCYCC